MNLKNALLWYVLSVVPLAGAVAQQAKPALRQNPYKQLPLGAIKPQGWLREMLVRQKNGATGQLDALYPSVMGQRNGWLGGDGDQWERGPYWLDGLVPLAYILDDKALIEKVKPWVEWSIKSQQPDGYFGPSKDYPKEEGIQRNNSHDWWPKMVMLKVLQQYYTATNDKRVINLLTNYFKYQLKTLPAKPLDHWSFWGKFRGGDNLQVVYWLYDITGDKFLLDLGELVHKQTFDYTNEFLNTDLLSRTASIHGVNLAQGLKEPLVYYQHHPDKKYLDATLKGYADLQKFNGTANGMYGADEALHGNNPTQGAEFCSVVEEMFSLETAVSITGGVNYADHLERIAFNALPAQILPDWINRQYFQQANQVMVTRHSRNFDWDHFGTDICYGLLTGYACCTSNMHQGWPKFTQNLWYTTPANGLAALVYSPSVVNTTVAGGKKITVTEDTNYPFESTIRFTVSNLASAASFPMELRIPAWCTKASIKVNGAVVQQPAGNSVATISRTWKSGDVVELELPMHVTTNNDWYENSVSVERGPLLYALKIGEEEKWIKNDKDPLHTGPQYLEVRPTTPWNYTLPKFNAKADLEKLFVFEKKEGSMSLYPWTQQDAPSMLKTRANRLPLWQIYNEMAGPVPFQSPVANESESITLIPYGCTRLRVSQFPQVKRIR